MSLGMKNQSSVTAQGIAAIRALESSKPPDQRICFDPLARRLVNPIYYLLVKLFAGYGDRKAPGTTGFLVARHRCIDDYLASCLQAGLDQLVVLGAGLDSRAYRPEILESRLRVFEVDHPPTQQDKCRKIRQIFGALPDHVVYVPIDFNLETLDVLFKFGYDRDRKTLFIWEGVTYYLAQESVDQTLHFIKECSAQGSAVIFDYVYPGALTASHRRGEIVRMQRYARITGENLAFGIDPGEIDRFLVQRGFTQIENLTADDLKQAYFSGINQARAVAPIYAVVRAVVN